MRPRLAATSLLIAALCAAPRAHASPQDLFGYGPRSIAMGGLGATFVDDSAAVHANPAGLARARARDVSLGYQGAVYALYTAREGEANVHAPVERARASTIGLTLPLPFGGPLTERVVLGFGFYTPVDIIVRGRILRPETPQFLVVADRAQSVALQMGLGVDVGCGLRLGAGFAAMAAITGTVVIATDATRRVGSRVDNQLVASYAPVAGAAFDAGPLRFGLVFRGVLEGHFRVAIEARDIGLPLPVFNIAGLAQYDPWQLAFEVGYARGPLTLALGATFKRWSEYPGLLEATTANSPRPPAVGFADTLVARAGAEYRWHFGGSEVALRGGYFFEPTPAPEAREAANYLDNDRHVGTLGLAVGGRALGTAVRMETFFQAHVLPERRSAKLDGVPADNPGAPTIRYGGAFYATGVTGTVTF
jgi:long-chain fatty acid transport protein